MFDWIIRGLGLKEETFVEGIQIDLFPDRMSALEENELTGQRFRLGGHPVEVVENSMLTVTVRYLPFWDRKVKAMEG